MTTGDVTQLGLLALAWAAVWANLVVIPFMRKRESLYKEYEKEGEIAAALSAIESQRLVPALARMFDRLLEGRDDQSHSPDIAELLQSVDFLPDFRQAEEAYRDMSGIEVAYKLLVTSSDLWKWGLAHTTVTVLLPIAFVDFVGLGAWSWVRSETLLPPLGVLWIATLVVGAYRLFRHNDLTCDFLTRLGNAKGVASAE